MKDGDLTLGDGGLGEEFGSANYSASLGRISGKLLSANLVRNGVDLTFRNFAADPDILYLDITNKKLGINTSSPAYEIDLSADFRTKSYIATSQAQIANIVINAPNTVSTVVGALQIAAADKDTPILFHRITTDNLEIRANYIGGLNNSSVVLDPNGAGTIELKTTTNVVGDVGVSGNILVSGNLAAAGTVIVGDTPYDTVSVTPSFNQGINTGTDNAYDLGNSSKRWANVYVEDWTTVNNLLPNTISVNSQELIDGVINKIYPQTTNTDTNILPSSGITYIEDLKFQGSVITNLDSRVLTGTPGVLSIYNVGLGYVDGVATSATGTRFNITTTGGGALSTISAVDNITAYIGQGNIALYQGGLALGGSFSVSGYTETQGMEFTSTGAGYLQFDGTGGVALPYGTTAQRPASPEVGDTRWNTDAGYLECFDGSIYIIATGPGQTINRNKMEDLGNIWTLILA